MQVPLLHPHQAVDLRQHATKHAGRRASLQGGLFTTPLHTNPSLPPLPLSVCHLLCISNIPSSIPPPICSLVANIFLSPLLVPAHLHLRFDKIDAISIHLRAHDYAHWQSPSTGIFLTVSLY